jgi:DNA-binding NarL/FixJ family response regulator
MLVLGLSNKEIARQQGSSISTVRTHVSRVLQKASVRSRVRFFTDARTVA